MTPAPEDSRLQLHLDGFEGPLDLLLDLARGQKLDLARISILALVEQYLAVVGDGSFTIVEGAHRIRLELAADWLVMAAWLAWLKSRLLLPNPAQDPEAEDATQSLASRLEDLQQVQGTAAWLASRPQLGLDTFPRGAPERFTTLDRTTLAADLPGLIRAYMAARRRAAATDRYTPRRLAFWTVADATARLHHLLGRNPGAWTTLDRALPPSPGNQVQRRAAIASTLLAGLELARDGTARLRQDTPWSPILIAHAA